MRVPRIVPMLNAMKVKNCLMCRFGNGMKNKKYGMRMMEFSDSQNDLWYTFWGTLRPSISSIFEVSVRKIIIWF
jgi:hypothetical protein